MLQWYGTSNMLFQLRHAKKNHSYLVTVQIPLPGVCKTSLTRWLLTWLASIWKQEDLYTLACHLWVESVTDVGALCRSEGVAFVLNTVDFGATIAKKDRHVPQNQAAAVPEEVLNRFCESFEPRQDVLAGQLVRRSLDVRSANAMCPRPVHYRDPC